MMRDLLTEMRHEAQVSLKTLRTFWGRTSDMHPLARIAAVVLVTMFFTGAFVFVFVTGIVAGLIVIFGGQWGMDAVFH